MSMVLDIASWILLVTGGLLLIVSGLGLLRLPDLFTRLHGGSLADTGGAVLMLVGMALQTEMSLITVKLLMIGIILLLTAPTASHAVAHSALIGGLSPDDPEQNQARDNAFKEDQA
tara:strand:- start:298 stop:645 length:348 start_codon:yes stop_codon:yes gene_type:complete